MGHAGLGPGGLLLAHQAPVSLDRRDRTCLVNPCKMCADRRLQGGEQSVWTRTPSKSASSKTLFSQIPRRLRCLTTRFLREEDDA
jgi:hypothetical protein